jgi:translation elongation factor P/translation initiation factor 5A
MATKARDNKITRVILPALYNTPGLTINAVLDKDGQPVKPLIEQMDEPVRTGKRGRPAKRWKLTKATRDKMRKQEKRAQEKVAEATVEATPEPALV